MKAGSVLLCYTDCVSACQDHKLSSLFSCGDKYSVEHEIVCRWLGVDNVFLRETNTDVLQKDAAMFQSLVDEGFLDFGQWEGEDPEATQLWYNRCAAPDMAGEHSWILFSNLDQYMVHMDEYVLIYFAGACFYVGDLHFCLLLG